MKNICYSIFFLFCFCNCYGQDNLFIYIRSAGDYSHIAEYDGHTNQQTTTIPDDDPTKYMYKNDELGIWQRGIVMIRFYDQDKQKLLKVGELDKNLVVTISVKGLTPIVYRPIGTVYEMIDLNIDFSDSKFSDLKNLKGQKDVSITVQYTNANYILRNVSGANLLTTATSTGTYFASKAEGYGLAVNDALGVWVPAIQFSTNFQANSNGIPFASLPIGGAIGSKVYYGKSGNYLGYSLMANWLIYNQPIDNSGSNTTSTKTNNYTFSSLTIGGLVDVNNYITLGAAYGFQFAKNSHQPGLMFVIGFGPDILNRFKSGKK